MKKNKAMKKMINKLRCKAGETLTETLVALLVGTMGLAMLASMIGVSTNLISDSHKELDDYYQDNLAIINQASSAVDGTTSAIDGTITNTVINGTDSFNITGSATGTDGTNDVKLYIHSYSGVAITTFK